MLSGRDLKKKSAIVRIKIQNFRLLLALLFLFSKVNKLLYDMKPQ